MLGVVMEVHLFVVGGCEGGFGGHHLVKVSGVGQTRGGRWEGGLTSLWSLM